MNKKAILTLLCGAAAATAVILAIAGHRIKKTDKPLPENGDTGNEASHQDYVTYEVDFGDGYIMYFDYKPGLREFGSMEFSGVVVDDFGQGTTMLTACHVPADRNANPDLPRTSEDYIKADIDAEFCDALPYQNGNASGYAYWERHEYSYGTGLTMGYNVFVGDEYFYVFVHRNDIWPEDIENVRIVKQ